MGLGPAKLGGSDSGHALRSSPRGPDRARLFEKAQVMQFDAHHLPATTGLLHGAKEAIPSFLVLVRGERTGGGTISIVLERSEEVIGGNTFALARPRRTASPRVGRERRRGKM